MAEDSEPSATKLKPREVATRSTLVALLGLELCGVMVSV
jgi:hypothetical protein